MKLTPDLLEATYDFLRRTSPFRRWSLPEGGTIEFVVGKTREKMGHYVWHPRKGYVIMISDARVDHTVTLLTTMAHEMIHLYQAKRGTETRAAHNAEFRRLAKIVCRHHGFDPLEF